MTIHLDLFPAENILRSQLFTCCFYFNQITETVPILEDVEHWTDLGCENARGTVPDALIKYLLVRPVTQRIFTCFGLSNQVTAEGDYKQSTHYLS